MKNFLIVVCCLLAIGCKKTSKPTGPQNPNYNKPMVFEILGLSDTTIEQVDTLELPIIVNLVSGTAVPLSLGVMNTPDSMTVFVDPQVDTPVYVATFRVITKGAALGTHVIQLRATGVNIQKDFYVQLNVIPNAVNPAQMLAGAYTETGTCSSSGNLDHTVNVSTIPTAFNQLRLNGIWASGGSYNVVAHINPANGTVSIPLQPVNGVTFSGTGVYDSSHIQIDYHVTDGFLVNDYCATTLTR